MTENSPASFTLEEFIKLSNKNLGVTPRRYYFERPVTDADKKVVEEIKRRLHSIIGESLAIMTASMNADVGFSVNLGKVIVTKSRGTASGVQITL